MSVAETAVPGARHTVVPKGIVATSWPKIRQTCRNIGWGFDPWQDAVGRLILAKRDGGKWAADLSILSIPRQVGKSYLLGCIIFALCLLNPRLRVIWTSHHTATTEEMYEAMKELASHKRVASHVTKCVALQGSRWRIQFRNGSRIDFGARSQGFGRGKARVGVLVLDEFQHISARALANLGPTTNTADNPLILCAGTPPGPEANGEAFTLRRKAALDGISDETLYVEFSADADADLDDRKQWARANPSFPKRTKERAFLLNRKILDDDDYRRDMLGIWNTAPPGVLGKWPSLADGGSVIPDPPALALDMTPDRAWCSIGAAGLDGDLLRVELVAHRRGSSWVVDWFTEKPHRKKYRLGIMPGAPAGSLIEPLRRAGVQVEEISSQEYAHGCGAFFDAYEAGTLRHRPDPGLDSAADGVQKTKREAFTWDRKSPMAVISPLVAVTLAAHLASQPVEERTFYGAWS